jgi:hypothetical protein
VEGTERRRPARDPTAYRAIALRLGLPTAT